MSIKWLTGAGTSAIFTNDTTGAATGCTGASTSAIDGAYAAWLVVNPPPPTILPISLIMLPTSNPGITGAIHIVNNTLYVSQGPSAAAVQIGTTGPTGSVAVI